MAKSTPQHFPGPVAGMGRAVPSPRKSNATAAGAALQSFLFEQTKYKPSPTDTLFRLLSELADGACRSLAETASIWLASQSKRDIACIVSAPADSGAAPPGPAGETRALSEPGLAGLYEALGQSRSRLLVSPADEETITRLVESQSEPPASNYQTRQPRISTALVIGIWLAGDLIGLLLLGRGSGTWSAEEASAATALAELAAARIASVKEHRTQVSLKLNELRVKRFIKNTPFAVAVFDRQMRFLVASERWRQDYGLVGRRIIGRSYYEVCPELPARWKDVHRAALGGAAQHCEEDTFTTADGDCEWIRWDVQPWYSHAGDIGGIVVLRDRITELKREQRARERLSSFVELNPAPVVEIDVRGNVQYMNDAAKHAFPDLPLKRFAHPFLGMVSRTVRSLQNGFADSATCQVRVGDRWFEQVVHFVPDDEAVRVFSIDITSRKQAEEEKSKLEQQVRAKSMV